MSKSIEITSSVITEIAILDPIKAGKALEKFSAEKGDQAMLDVIKGMDILTVAKIARKYDLTKPMTGLTLLDPKMISEMILRDPSYWRSNKAETFEYSIRMDVKAMLQQLLLNDYTSYDQKRDIIKAIVSTIMGELYLSLPFYDNNNLREYHKIDNEDGVDYNESPVSGSSIELLSVIRSLSYGTFSIILEMIDKHDISDSIYQLRKNSDKLKIGPTDLDEDMFVALGLWRNKMSALAKIEEKPLLILALNEIESEGSEYISFMKKAKKQLVDMSLNLASKYYSIVYLDDLEMASKVVLGIAELGLFEYTQGDLNKAKTELIENGVLNSFRKGWGLFLKIPLDNKTSIISVLSEFAIEVNEVSDVNMVFNKNLKKFKEEKNYIEIYNLVQGNQGIYDYKIDPVSEKFPILLKFLIGENNPYLISKKELYSIFKYINSVTVKELKHNFYSNSLIINLIDSLPSHLKYSMNKIIQEFYDEVIPELYDHVRNSECFVAYSTINLLVLMEDTYDIISELSGDLSDFSKEYWSVDNFSDDEDEEN